MHFPKSNDSMINPNIRNCQQSPLFVNMTDVIINLPKHQNETPNLPKNLQIITYLSTLQSARKINTTNANPWTTIQPAHSIFTMTKLQLCGSLYTLYRPKSLQQDNSQWDCACVAKVDVPQQQHLRRNWRRNQGPGIGRLQGIAAIWLSSVEGSFRTFAALISLLESFFNLGSMSQNQHLIPHRYCWLYPQQAAGGCHPEEGSCGHHALASGHQTCCRLFGYDIVYTSGLGCLISSPPLPFWQ